MGIMKLILPAFVLGNYVAAQVTTQDCYTCTAVFDAYTVDSGNCWSPNSNTVSSACTGYCAESITFEDGWPAQITRGCNVQATDSDFNYQTTNQVTCDNTDLKFRDFFA